MRALAVCLFAILVAGCVTQSERAAQVQRDVDDMIQVYGPGCEKLGYKTDSDQWRDCVVKLATKDNLERYKQRLPCRVPWPENDPVFRPRPN